MSDCKDFADWRRLAREGITAAIAPDRMRWTNAGLLFNEAVVLSDTDKSFKCPREFLDMAQTLACHRSPEKWDLLYRILWELTHGKEWLLKDVADPLVYRASILVKQVKRDIHKMTAFVRFKKIRDDPQAFVAWHEPDHLIIKAASNFFVKRFGSMNWAILTPDGGMAWNCQKLTWIEGPLVQNQILNDSFEDLWKSYFKSIFNPARLKIDAMKREMPVRYWKNMPETELIPEMIAGATQRMNDMIKSSHRATQTQKARGIPRVSSLNDLRQKLIGCQSCELCVTGRPAVASKGSVKARIMIVGEQPGDQEDQQGLPFVGPAGQMLNGILNELGVNQEDVYFTNAVKHFRFQWKGKMRVHMKPGITHMKACKSWLEQEIALLQPEYIVCLGATAAHAVLGYALPVHAARESQTLVSDVIESSAKVRVSFHPSAILRAQGELATQMRADLKQDLQKVFHSP